MTMTMKHPALRNPGNRGLAARLLSVRTMVLTVLTLALIPAMFLFGQSQANAHDVLVDQTPHNGEILDSSPETITLSYNNELLDAGTGTSIITVSDADGNDLDFGFPEVTGRDAVLTLGDLDDGAYRAVWTVVSSDGHRIAGEFFFGVGDVTSDDLTALQEKTASAGADQEESQADEGDAEKSEDNASQLSPVAITGMAVAGVGIVVLAGVMFWRKSKRSL